VVGELESMGCGTLDIQRAPGEARTERGGPDHPSQMTKRCKLTFISPADVW
jgi:hypothetical protein